MSGRSPWRALALGLLAFVSASPMTARPVAAVPPSVLTGEPGLRSALDVMDGLDIDHGKVTRPARDAGQPIGYGKDGRFTILLIGSDWRAQAGGERLDVLIVMTIDPSTGRAAAASIPRDMIHIPYGAGNGHGDSGQQRVNAIYLIRYRNAKLPHAAVDDRALTRFTRDIAELLGTEIDGWAMLRFSSFADAVNAIGGVTVKIPQPIRDSSYHSRSKHGIYFPAAKAWKLSGNPACGPFPRKCRSALVYARSRHGSVGSSGNNDYRRAARQQQVVLAAVKKVVEHHGAGLALLLLLGKIRRYVVTSLPTTPAAAAQLYKLLEHVRMPATDMKVLAPSTWAYTDKSTPLYTYRPNLKAIHRWVDRAFYKLRPESPS